MAVLELSFASGETSLSVRRFSVHEAASALFTVSIWARSLNENLDLGSIVGKPAGLRIASGYEFAFNGDVRLWTGICNHIEQIQAEPKGMSTYSFRIVPTLWLLTQRRNHRIFQHLSIPAIADELLGEWSIEPVWKIDRGQYPKLEYKVQYGESDYTFLSRLLEEAGIAFTFPEDAEGSKLTLGDKLHANAPRPTPPIHYADNPNQASGKEYVTNIRPGHQVRPGAHTIRDVDFRKPSFPLFGEAPKAKAPEDRYEQYHYQPGAFLVETGKGGGTPVADDKGIARHDEEAGMDRAERALLGERSGKRGVSFDTNAFDVGPGVVFSIGNHPHAEVAESTKLLVTELSIDGSSGEEWSASGHAVFADIPYRPQLETPKPRLVGVQSATVVGPKGQEVHTDEFGRVRVQFPWDREGKNLDGSSCWIRVSQGWGGTGFGMMLIPRIGQELLVGFLEGDPDQPVVVGRVFNATSPVPYKLPDNKTISTWKSDSSPGSGGFNEIKYDDKKGEELFYVQGEKNLRKLVKNNETITVGRNRTKYVGVNETDTTGVNRIEVTGVNRTETTGMNRTTVIGGNRAKQIDENEIERTEGNRLLRVGKDWDVVVKKEKEELVEGDSHRRVGGNLREQVGGKQSLMVVEDQHANVGENHALEAGKKIHLKSDEVMVAEAAQDVTIKGPGGFIRIDAGGVTIKGTLVKINVSGTAGKGAGSDPSKPKEPKEAKVDAPCPPQEPAIATVTGPMDLGCGGFDWTVWFNMPKPACSDGWVIQEVLAKFEVQAADGTSVLSAERHYWEAWEVKKGKTMTVWQDQTLDTNDDQYSSSSRPRSKGVITYAGTAKFYEGPLPSDFKKGNPQVPMAGILHATTKQPKFWDGSGTPHNITSTWDCTGSAATSVVSAQAGSQSLTGAK